MTQKMLMKKLMALDFMIIDMGLFLDTHPHDKEALETLKCISDESAKLRRKYEEEYGPLSVSCGGDHNRWRWIDDPWPWQKENACNLRGE